MIKKVLSFLLLFCLIFAQTGSVYAEKYKENNQVSQLSKTGKVIFHGHAEINEGLEPEDDIFTGETTTVEKGTTLKMTVSQVICTGYNREGDEFFAEIVNDLDVPGGVAIPAGTLAHGRVTKMKESKRLGRDAYVTLEFDYLVTPDNREIPIEAKMTTKRNPVSSIAKVALEDTAYTVAGGLAGGLAALRLFGYGAAVASNGYTIAGGAGVGALVGAGIAIGRKGSEVLIAPGDEIKVKISGALELPTISDEALKEEELEFKGLDVRIVQYNLEKDPFGEENTITLGLLISNQTKKTFSSFDMALINDYKAVYYPSPFGNTGMWFTKIRPNARVAGRLSFSVDNPKRKHWLVFYDSRSRKPIAKISVDNAKKAIKKAKKNRKKKKK